MSDIQKTYAYKVSRNGNFIGYIPDVQSQFGYNQNIDTAGAQLEIVIQQSPVQDREAVEYIITESGDRIVTESGDPITTERIPEIVGNNSDSSLIRNNNDVEVYEFSEDNPNGVLVFQGYISKWKATFGGENNIISCTVISYGAELDNYLIFAVPTVDNSQTTSNMYGTSRATWEGLKMVAPASRQWVAQTITIGTGVDNLSAVDLRLKADTAADEAYVEINVYNYDGSGIFTESGTPLGTARRFISSAAAAVYQFGFTNPIPVVAGQQYIITVRIVLGATQTESYIQIGATHPSAYAGGQALVTTSGTDNNFFYVPTPSGFFAAADLYFKTYYSSGETSSPFNSQDPASMLTQIIDAYNAQGGVITYDATSIEATGTTRSYTFKVNTILEGVKKVRELAPISWYWYVDPATGIIYFKEASSTADHVFVRGNHIDTLDIEANVENVKNIVYFTGGDTGGGSNLYTSQQDADSLEVNRRGLERLTDNRVTVTDTANAIMESFLDDNADEKFITQVTILDTTYDLTTINLGEIVGFGGFGNFVDFMLLQIVGLERRPHSVTLKLGALPLRATQAIENAIRAITDVQTIDNPDAPS